MGRGAESWRRRHISDTSAVAAAPALVHLQRNDGPADLEDELTDDAAFEPEDDADEPIAEALGLSKRFYLSIDDDIVHAPSIGPRTAGRLRPLGIRRVRDLLGCPPGKLYEMLASRHISKLRIEAWQHQARLVCTVPWLRGTHAQLLVGAGYVSAAAIVAADRAAVCAAVLRFAVTREGQSILRSGAAPDIEKIMRWTDHARLAELTRAA